MAKDSTDEETDTEPGNGTADERRTDQDPETDRSQDTDRPIEVEYGISRRAFGAGVLGAGIAGIAVGTTFDEQIEDAYAQVTHGFDGTPEVLQDRARRAEGGITSNVYGDGRWIETDDIDVSVRRTDRTSVGAEVYHVDITFQTVGPTRDLSRYSEDLALLRQRLASPAAEGLYETASVFERFAPNRREEDEFQVNGFSVIFNDADGDRLQDDVPMQEAKSYLEEDSDTGRTMYREQFQDVQDGAQLYTE